MSRILLPSAKKLLASRLYSKAASPKAPLPPADAFIAMTSPTTFSAGAMPAAETLTKKKNEMDETLSARIDNLIRACSEVVLRIEVSSALLDRAANMKIYQRTREELILLIRDAPHDELFKR